jgi:hypothetical protein
MTEGELPEQGQVQPPEEGLQGQGSLQPSSGDPLDEIKDVDAAIAEAKKYRAIANRKSQSKPEAPTPTPPPAAPQPASDVVTKTDLNRINTKAAKGIVDATIRDNWDAIIDYVPAKYRNAETPDEIAQGMKIAHKAWLEDNPPAPNNGTELQTSKVITPSAKPEPSGERKTQPILRNRSSSMRDWYPKPNA